MKKIAGFIIVLSMLATGAAIYLAVPMFNLIGVDWWLYFQPAALRMLHGFSPYSITGYYNPPWTLIPLAPFAILPLNISIPLMFTFNLAAYVYIAMRLGMNRIAMLPFVVFGGVLMNSFMGNIDGLILLGLLCPPWLTLIILMSKPQIGIPILLFLVGIVLFSSDDLQDKARRLFRLLFPLAFIGLVSIAIYGNWYTHAAEVVDKNWNTSPWPHGLPLGVYLLWMGIMKRDIRWALMSVPFTTPYLSPMTWAIPLMGLLALIPQWANDVKRVYNNKRNVITDNSTI